MTRGRRIGVDDECPLKWCNEAGDHDVHRQYLASLTTRDGHAIGVNVVQPGTNPRTVELTIAWRSGPSQIVTLAPGEGDAIAEAMRAAAHRAGDDGTLLGGDGS